MEAIKKQEVCLQQKQDELGHKLTRLTEQQRLLHDKLSVLGEKKANLHEKDTKLQEHKRNLLRKHEEVRQNEEELKEAEREETERLRDAERQLANIQQMYEAGTRALEQYEGKYNALVEDHAKRATIRQRKILAMESELKIAQKKLQDSRAREQALRHDWEHQQNELDPLLQQRRSLIQKQQSFMKRAHSEMLEFRHLPTLTEQVRTLRREVTDSKDELSKLSDNLGGLEKTLMTQLETVLLKQEQLQALKAEELRLKERIGDLEKNRQSGLKQHHETLEQTRLIEANYVAKEEKLNKLNASNAEIENKLKYAQTQLAEQGEVLCVLESKQRDKLEELEQREELIHIRLELEAELDAKFKDFDMTEDSWKRVKEHELNKIMALLRQLNEKQMRLNRRKQGNR